MSESQPADLSAIALRFFNSPGELGLAAALGYMLTGIVEAYVRGRLERGQEVDEHVKAFNVLDSEGSMFVKTTLAFGAPQFTDAPIPQRVPFQALLRHCRDVREARPAIN